MRKILSSISIATLGLFSMVSMAQATVTVNGTIYSLTGEEITGADCTVYLFQNNTQVDDASFVSAVDGTFSITSDNGSGVYDLIISDGNSSQNCDFASDQGNYDFGNSTNGEKTGMYLVDEEPVDVNAYINLEDNNGTIRGKILDENGSPVANQSVSLTPKYSEALSSNYSGTTDSTGKFSITAPIGMYDLRAAGDGTNLGYLYRDVELPINAVIDLGNISYFTPATTPLSLTFVDATNNALTFDRVSVLAYAVPANDVLFGAYTTTSNTGGSITSSEMSLTANEDWIVNVTGISGNILYYGSAEVTANTTSGNFVLTELYTYDDSNIVNQTFNARTDTTLQVQSVVPTATGPSVLDTGVDFEVTFPAYAIDDEDADVQVVIEPTFDLPATTMPIGGSTYNITIYDTSTSQIHYFNKPVTMVMPYDEAEVLALSILESEIVPAYFDEDTDDWKYLPPQQFVIDEVNNEITLTVWHASQYAVVADRALDITQTVTTGNENFGNKVPKKLKAKNITDSSALLTWKRPTKKGVRKYQVKISKCKKTSKTACKISKTNNWKSVKTVKVGKKAKRKYLAEELQSNKYYQFAVRARYGSWARYSAYKRFKTAETN